MCQLAHFIAKKMNPVAVEYEDCNELRNQLWSLLCQYKAVLGEHDIELPFSEQPRT